MSSHGGHSSTNERVGHRRRRFQPGHEGRIQPRCNDSKLLFVLLQSNALAYCYAALPYTVDSMSAGKTGAGRRNGPATGPTLISLLFDCQPTDELSYDQLGSKSLYPRGKHINSSSLLDKFFPPWPTASPTLYAFYPVYLLLISITYPTSR